MSRLVIGILLICAAAIIVDLMWRRPPKPVLASLNIDALDPMVAAAVNEGQDAVRSTPMSGTAWGKLGSLLFVHGMDRPAAGCFARASELEPGEPRWPYLRGRAIKRENGDAALPFLKRAAELCHGVPAAPSLTLAELLLERGEFVQTEEQIALVLQRNPADARALLDRAQLQFARGELPGAMRDAEESIRIAPGVKISRMFLATLYGRGGDVAAVSREVEQARKLRDDPAWPDPFFEEIAALAIGRSALVQRVSVLLAQGQTKQAIIALEAAASQYADDAEVLEILGEAYRQDARPAQAEAAFRRSVATKSGSLEALLRLGEMLCEQHRFSDALEPLTAATRLNPNLPETHYDLGMCQLGLGNPTSAGVSFRKAVLVEPSYQKGYVALGEALQQSGRPDEAATQFRRALELNGDDQATRARLKEVESVSKNPRSK